MDQSEARSWTRGAMAMLVSILGLWANKNTFINRNDTSGEMLDSLDARDISLRLEDQSVHNLMFPHSLQYCQEEVLASTQFYGNESMHSNSTIGMSVFERSVEAPFVALFALWIFVVMPVVLSDTFYLTRKLSRVCTDYKLGLIAPYIMGMTIPLHCIAFVLFLAHFSVRAIAFAMCTCLWHMFRFVRLYLGETGTYIFDLIFFVPIFYLLNACGAFEISGADSVLMMVGDTDIEDWDARKYPRCKPFRDQKGIAWEKFLQDFGTDCFACGKMGEC